jgi:zinc protease
MSYTVDQRTWTPGRYANGLYEFTLNANGLKVLLCPMPSGKRVVSVNVTYNVGSAMERQGETGYCHLLEHANFKHANVWKHQAVGATINATTRNDITNYYATLPLSDMGAYLHCEADRMIQPHFTQADLDKEMPVVHNEYERGENSCFQALHKAVIASSMVSHPYHHSTIGYDLDIRRVTEASLKSFFHRFYVPNNAALTITGDFSLGKALDSVAAEFNRVPRSAHAVPPRNFFEVKQEGMKQVLLHRADRASLVAMAFHAPPAHNSDSLAMEVIAKLISNGELGRAKALREQGSFFDVGMMTQRMRDTYPVLLVGQMRTPQQNQGAQMMFGLLNRFKQEAVPLAELAAAKKAVLRAYDTSDLGPMGMMNAVNDALQRRWDAFDLFDRIKVVEALTPLDVQRAAKHVFNEDAMTLGRYLPNAQAQVVAFEPSPLVGLQPYSAAPCEISHSGPVASTLYASASKTWNFGGGGLRLNLLPRAQGGKTRCVISSLMHPTHVSQFHAVAPVAAQLFGEGVYVNGVAVPGDQFKSYMNDRGIDLKIKWTSRGMDFLVTCDESATEEALKLVSSVVKTPVFPVSRLPAAQSQVASSLQSHLTVVDKAAAQHLLNAMYPPEHPRYAPSIQEGLKRLQHVSYGDIVDFHKRVLSGSFKVTCLSNADIVDAVKHLVPTNVSKTQALSLTTLPPPQTQTFLIPGKTSAALQMGLPVNLSRLDPDYMPLRLAAMALGNGFTGRLMKHVRDEAGLTYGIYADLVGGDPGVPYDSFFKVQSSFNPQVFYKGKAMALGLIHAWAQEGITAKELEQQRGFWKGHRSVSLSEPALEAQIVHRQTCDNAPLSQMDDFDAKLDRVTLDQVNAALKKYIQPENLHVVEVGSLQKK